jgi:hypothetical protein
MNDPAPEAPPEKDVLKELTSKVGEELKSIHARFAKEDERPALLDEIKKTLGFEEKSDGAKRLVPHALLQIVAFAGVLSVRLSDHKVLLVQHGMSVYAKAAERNKRVEVAMYAHLDLLMKDLLAFVFKKCQPDVFFLEAPFTRPSEI